MILGAQLYTLRDYCSNEKDFNISMERVAKLGYTTVQISGHGPIDSKKIRQICDNHGLKIVLTHTPQERVLYETDAVIEEHNILGCDYIGIGSMPTRYQGDAWIEQFKSDYKEPAQKIAKAGKLFMYHNHHFEFMKLGDKRMIDYLLEAFSPEEMGFTLDTYWVQAAGCDVIHWIEKLGDRLPCVHLKDMEVVQWEGKYSSVFAPVLEGNMNFPGILEALKRAGSTKYLLVEQDATLENPFVCLEKSYKNLAALGYK